MKTIKTTDGEVVFCDVCEASATLAVEMRDGTRMCAECVMVAAALVSDARNNRPTVSTDAKLETNTNGGIGSL